MLEAGTDSTNKRNIEDIADIVSEDDEDITVEYTGNSNNGYGLRLLGNYQAIFFARGAFNGSQPYMGEFGWKMKQSILNNEGIHKKQHDIDLVTKKRDGTPNVAELVDGKWTRDIYVRKCKGENTKASLEEWGSKIVAAIVNQKTRYQLKIKYLKDTTRVNEDGEEHLRPLDSILLDTDCVYLAKKRYGKAINAHTFITSNQAKYFFAESRDRTTLESLLY